MPWLVYVWLEIKCLWVYFAFVLAITLKLLTTSWDICPHLGHRTLPSTPDALNLPAFQTSPLALYVHPEERPLSGRDSKGQAWLYLLSWARRSEMSLLLLWGRDVTTVERSFSEMSGGRDPLREPWGLRHAEPTIQGYAEANPASFFLNLIMNSIAW